MDLQREMWLIPGNRKRALISIGLMACFLLFAADSLGCRKSLLWTSIGLGVAKFIMGIYLRIYPPVKGAPTPPFGYVALVCIFLYAGFFQSGWGPCRWIYVSEIPTARLRSLNVGLAADIQWLTNLSSREQCLPCLLRLARGGYGAYFTFGSFCFLMFIFVYFLIPETMGL